MAQTWRSQFLADWLYALLHDAKRKQSLWISIVLTITDLAMKTVAGIKRLFGGSYSGSMGQGQLGSIVVMMSALIFIVVSIAAAVVMVPLGIIAWILRKKIDRDINAEKTTLIPQVTGFFEDMAT